MRMDRYVVCDKDGGLYGYGYTYVDALADMAYLKDAGSDWAILMTVDEYNARFRAGDTWEPLRHGNERNVK